MQITGSATHRTRAWTWRIALSLSAVAVCGESACSAPARPEASTPPASPAAQPGAPAAAPAVCGSSEKITIQDAGPQGTLDGPTLALTPNPFGMGPPRSSWRGDLNADGLSDMIVSFPEGCGNWGECPRGVFVGCGGDAYVNVWEPEYSVALEVDAHETVVAGVAWRDLVETLRLDSMDEDGNLTDGAETRVLTFDGSRYRRAQEPRTRSLVPPPQ
jgi:hypothetical protein